MNGNSISGWCMNTPKGTVKGYMEGDEVQVRAMMRWLQTRGSPNSVIAKATFGKLKDVAELSVSNFVIKYWCDVLLWNAMQESLTSSTCASVQRTIQIKFSV